MPSVTGHPLATQTLWSKDPIRLYPDPDYRDVIVVERLSRKQSDYQVQASGTAYPWDGKAGTNPFPNHMLVDEKEDSDGEHVLRYYAYDRAESSQQTYNAATITYEADSVDHPIFTRDYFIRRGAYSPTTRLTTISGLITAKMTAVGSGYVPGMTTASLSGGTGSGGTVQVFVNPAGQVIDIEIVSAGNYTGAPAVTINGVGAGATATVSIQPQSAVLVTEEQHRLQDETLDALYVMVRRVHMTLPGPWVTVENKALPGSVFRRIRSRFVAATTFPVSSTNVISDIVGGQSTTVATETEISYTDDMGNEVSAPIYVRIEYSSEWSVFMYFFRQLLASPGVLASISTTGTGLVNMGSQVASLTMTNLGGGYEYIPAITIAPSSGTQATAHVTVMDTDNFVTVVQSGAASIGDFLTISDGVFSIACVLQVTAVGVIGVTVSTPGSGVFIGMILTLVGGTHTSSAQAMVATVKLVSIPVIGAGINYHVGDTVTLAGGTFSTQAIVTLASTTLVTLAVNAIGTAYAIGDFITLSGGTHSVAGIFQVTTLALATVSVNAAGTRYTPGQTVTLGGGTFTSQAIVTVATVKLNTVGISGGYGAGYAPAEVITLQGGTFSVAAKVTVTNVGIVSLAINAGGSGYAANDTVVLAGGTGTKGIIGVLTVDGSGAILTFTISGITGAYTATSATFTQDSTSGGGTGATFKSAVYGVNVFAVTTAGNFTATTSVLTQSSSTGTGTGAVFVQALYGLLTVTVGTHGNYSGTLPTAFTQVATSGSGTGGTFNSPTWGVGTGGITTGGTYTVESATFTQASTSGGGSGATFNTPIWGGNTVTASTPGEYSVLPSNFLQASTSGSGTGIAFNMVAALFGAVTATITQQGFYTGSLPGSFTVSGPTGVVFTPTGSGASNCTITTPGRFTQLPPVGVTDLLIDNPGIGYAIGDTIVAGIVDLSLQIGIVVTAIKGTGTTGPIKSIRITDPGTGSGAPQDDKFPQLSTSGTGLGASFKFPQYRLVSATSGASGTITVSIGFKIHTVAMLVNGDHYFTPPAVVFQGQGGAAATAALSPLGSGGLVTGTTYVVDSGIDPIPDTDRVWSRWTMMPIPPTRVDFLPYTFTFPGRFTILENVFHLPPWPGFDFVKFPSVTASWTSKRTRTFKLGMFGAGDIPPEFFIISPGNGSADFPIGRNDIHPAFAVANIVNGVVTYAERFDASYVAGFNATSGYNGPSKTIQVMGPMWCLESILIPP